MAEHGIGEKLAQPSACLPCSIEAVGESSTAAGRALGSGHGGGVCPGGNREMSTLCPWNKDMIRSVLLERVLWGGEKVNQRADIWRGTPAASVSHIRSEFCMTSCLMSLAGFC